MSTSAAPARSYRELGPLAEGGMAVLCLGERDDGTKVVIKRIRPPWEHDAGYRGLFRDEGAVAARLCSDHIVRLLDQGEDELGPYLVFELVDGTDLGVVLAKLPGEERGLDLGAFFAVALPMVEALRDAHEACDDEGESLCVVHRDVSPGNVLLGKDGEVKLADFGVAASTLKTEHTVAGEMKGKFAYMSPEQSRGESVDARADLFAAGVVLWECLTARRLFDGPTDADVVHAVREGSVAPPSRHNPDVPVALDEVIARFLARDPDARFASARAAHDALLEVARELLLDTGGKRHVTRLARAYPRPTPDEHPHVTAVRRRTQRVMQAPGAERAASARRGRARLWAAAAVVVLASAGGLWLARADEPAPAREEVVDNRTPPPSPAPAPLDPPRNPPSPPTPSPEDGVETTTTTTTTPPPAPTVVTSPDKPAPAKATLAKATKAAKAATRTTTKTTKTTKTPAPAPKAAPERGFGQLSLVSEPWGDVSIDGNPLGQQTPILRMKLPAGRHAVTLQNPHYKLRRTITVEIEAGEETRRFVDLTER